MIEFADLAFIGSVIGSVGAALVGGLLANKGQADANESNERIAAQTTATNIEEARRAREFNREQATVQFGRNQVLQDRAIGATEGMVARQIGFQERMANTTVSRQVADMRRAGINPVLAARHQAPAPGGASGAGASASAAAASGPAGRGVPATMVNEWAGAVSSAAGLARAMQEVQLADAQIDLVKQQTKTEVDRGLELWYRGRKTGYEAQIAGERASLIKKYGESAGGRLLGTGEQIFQRLLRLFGASDASSARQTPNFGRY